MGHGDRWAQSSDVESVASSPDSTHFVTTSTDAIARLWKISPTTQALVEYAKRTVLQRMTAEELKRFYLFAPPRWRATSPGLEGEDIPDTAAQMALSRG